MQFLYLLNAKIKKHRFTAFNLEMEIQHTLFLLIFMVFHPEQNSKNESCY